MQRESKQASKQVNPSAGSFPKLSQRSSMAWAKVGSQELKVSHMGGRAKVLESSLLFCKVYIGRKLELGAGDTNQIQVYGTRMS